MSQASKRELAISEWAAIEKAHPETVKRFNQRWEDLSVIRDRNDASPAAKRLMPPPAFCAVCDEHEAWWFFEPEDFLAVITRLVSPLKTIKLFATAEERDAFSDSLVRETRQSLARGEMPENSGVMLSIRGRRPA